MSTPVINTLAELDENISSTTATKVLTALDDLTVALDATEAVTDYVTDAKNAAGDAYSSKQTTTNALTAAKAQLVNAEDAAVASHAAQIAKDVATAKAKRQDAGIAAGVAYKDANDDQKTENNAGGSGALGKSLAARNAADAALGYAVDASVAAGVSHINSSGAYVAATGGAESIAKTSEDTAATALITYNVSLNEYRNALAVPILDSDRLSQADLDGLLNIVNDNADSYNTAKAQANKDREAATEAAASATDAVKDAEAAEVSALAAEAAAAAANRYYLQTVQDVLNADRKSVSVNMNIEIDAQNNINIFGEKPVLPTNVIEARYKLPVDALYDNETDKGLIEFWEPDDTQGDIRVQLANSNLCGEATAEIAAGAVTSITVDNGGSGYKTAPLIMLESTNGYGSGAVALAVLVDGVIDQIVVEHGGSGYTAAPRVRIVSSYQKDYTGAYKYCAVKFVNGMERILCDQFDCSNATPFSDRKYRDSDGIPIEQYTKQRDFGRVSLATLSHYLFGHVDATAAITNDVEFVQSMLSLANDDDADLAVQYELDDRYKTDDPDNTDNDFTGQAKGAVLRNAKFTQFEDDEETVDMGLMALEGSASDAMLAKRLMGAILKKGLRSDGTFMTSNVIANAATDKSCLANIVRQVLGQDETRSMNEDNSQRAIDQHALLRFYAGDVIYMNIKVKRPNVTVSPGPTNMPSKASDSYATEISFSLKVTLTEKA